MSINNFEFKSHFALKIKLKSLNLYCEDFNNVLKLKFRIYYDGEDERKTYLSQERTGIIEILNGDCNMMLKHNINKSFYLPIVCLKGEKCPQFINIICNIGKKRKDLGLKLYLSKNYSFLKHYGSYKVYNLYDCNSGIAKGHLELALDIVNYNHPLPYFGKKQIEMGLDDHYLLATEISISKLWKEMLIHSTDRDTDAYIESFRIIPENNLSRVQEMSRNNLLSLFRGSSKNAYEKVPLPLISSSNLFNYFYMEVCPQYKKNKHSWLRIFNDVYDMYFMYDEIRACALFFYLESAFIRMAANFAKHYKVNFGHNFRYKKITGKSPLDVFKFFERDEVYVTNDSYVLGEGLIGILIFGDDKTDTSLAYKKYNRELKAHQWINKGIAKVKNQNLKILSNASQGGEVNETVSLSLLSFNLSTLVSYKGFKMYVIPSPVFPLEIMRLDQINVELKHELNLLEKAIPTYGLLKLENRKDIFLTQYHSKYNYVFYNINSMLAHSNKRHFPLFENPESVACDMQGQKDSGIYKEKYFYSNYIKVRRNIDLYHEDVYVNRNGKSIHEKYTDIHIKNCVREIESLSFSVPFDSISLKMHLHSRGIKMKHLGKMLSFVSLRWLHDMILNEILIRCIKRYVFSCMREICIFYKKKVNQYLANNLLKGQRRNMKNTEKKISDSYENFHFSVESENLSDEVDEFEGQGINPCYFPNEKKNMYSSKTFSQDSEYYTGSSESTYSLCSPNNCEKKRKMCSKKKAMKSFICMKSMLSKEAILENHMFRVIMRGEDADTIDSTEDRNMNKIEQHNDALSCDYVLNKLLNFDEFTKYTNAKMYILKKSKYMKKEPQESFHIMQKRYKGNVTLIDMFIINLFNLIFTQKDRNDCRLLSVLKNICSKYFHISLCNTIEESYKNYLYENLQKSLGIFFYHSSLVEYSKKKNKLNKTFSMHHLKSYNLKIKRSLNIMYIDIPMYRYIQYPERISLNISNDKKKILSNFIFFTLMYYHHHLNVNNEVYTEQLLMNEWKIKKSGKMKKEDLPTENAGIYKTRLNSLLASKDNITLYNNSNYLTIYGLLNIIALGIKLGFFEGALKISTSFFRYIPENSVISVHVRIMWLYIYALKESYDKIGNFHRIQKSDENMIKKSFRTDNLDNIPYEVQNKHKVEKFTKGCSRSIPGRGIFLFDDQESVDCANYSDFSTDIFEEKSISHFSKISSDCFDRTIDKNHCEKTFQWSNLEKENISFRSGGTLDLYKKTHEMCSTILKNYFVFFHPIYLDFYLSLAWYNKSVNNYCEFLLLLRTIILLQLNMSSKNYVSEKVENVVKLSDNFENLVYFNFDISAYNHSSKKNEKEAGSKFLDKVRNISSFFLNNICYPHEDIFFCCNIETTAKYSTVFSIRLGCTVHYFLNSLFYYYNKNRVIRMYKNENFVMNGSLCCINVLEYVRDIFRFFGSENVYVARTSLDLSLMTLKTYFYEMIDFSGNCLIAYALANVHHAEKIFRKIFGINHIETLYSLYVLSIIYLHLNNERSLYIFEEICYYLLNYKYSYDEDNVINTVFWYIPDLVETHEGVNGKLVLRKNKIKWYLLHIWFNICIGVKYIRKIRKILFLLCCAERCKRRKNKCGRRNHDKDTKGNNENNIFGKINSYFDKRCDNILGEGDTLRDYCLQNFDEEHLFPYDQLVSCIRGYRYIFTKEELFIQMDEYNDLLKYNKCVLNGNTTTIVENNERATNTIPGMQDVDKIRLLPLLWSRIDKRRVNTNDIFSNGLVKSDMCYKNEFANYEYHPHFRNDETVENYIKSENWDNNINGRGKKKKKKSVTDYYLKKLINMVENHAELLYKEEKYELDTMLHVTNRKNKNYENVSLIKFLKMQKLKVNNKRDDKKFSLLKQNDKIIFDNSEIDTVSFLNSKNGADYSEDSLEKSINTGRDYPNSDKRDKGRVHYKCVMQKKNQNIQKDALMVSNDVHILISLIYHFFNFEKFQQFYSRETYGGIKHSTKAEQQVKYSV
ncbi:hypothetical protein, conserved [Plasmodium gonderi]|uniref:CLU central domain-containing protein n=1 Tax=Plasmodium gonderi TaxID=77519 RepID=A0A1Y1JD34_PLAGO|nr:hypothetical protein, conserved [Plasmodium gonderi]GAW80150.1 hypothetical protein, conserved [Plasmodium gonderi]